MEPVKIGIQLSSLGLPFKQALHTAARLGAQGVEIDARQMVKPSEMTRTGVRHLRKMLEDLNLRTCAVGFRTRRGYDDPNQLEPRIEGTKRALEMAYQLGARVVINHIGQIPDEFAGPSWDTLRQALVEIGNHGQHVGTWLAADTVGDAGSRLKALLDVLPSGTLAVNFNPGRLIVEGVVPRDELARLAPFIQHIHATDGARDMARRRGIVTELGRGSVDYQELLAALEEQQYRGYLTIECEPSADAVLRIGNAVQYLKAVLSP